MMIIPAGFCSVAGSPLGSYLAVMLYTFPVTWSPLGGAAASVAHSGANEMCTLVSLSGGANAPVERMSCSWPSGWGEMYEPPLPFPLRGRSPEAEPGGFVLVATAGWQRWSQ